MKQIPLLVFAVLLLTTVSYAQWDLVPRMGEGSVNRSEQAVFWGESPYLNPSFFWSKGQVDPGLNRKWWRNETEAPKLNTEGMKKKLTIAGEIILVTPIVEGSVGLYQEYIAVNDLPKTSKIDTETTFDQQFRYWVGTNSLHRITPENYKDLVKQLLTNSTGLHKRLGSKGFRFENLPSMVWHHNYLAGDQVQFSASLGTDKLLLRP